MIQKHFTKWLLVFSFSLLLIKCGSMWNEEPIWEMFLLLREILKTKNFLYDSINILSFEISLINFLFSHYLFLFIHSNMTCSFIFFISSSWRVLLFSHFYFDFYSLYSQSIYFSKNSSSRFFCISNSFIKFHICFPDSYFFKFFISTYLYLLSI